MVILINGKKRSGKDYTAEKLSTLMDTETVSFASPLKGIMARTFGITEAELDDYKNEDKELYMEHNEGSLFKRFINFRQILQNFGNEGAKEEFGQNVWAERAHIKAMDVVENGRVPVLADFRFLVESEVFKNEKKVFTIYVKNDDIPDADMHASEKELGDANFEFDYILDNTGHPSDYDERLINIVNAIKSKSL